VAVTDADFAVLMPVYRRDLPQQVQQAFDSVAKHQTLTPSEIVIVQDGPVGVVLGRQLQELSELPTVRLLVLPENQGLAKALNAGLRACSFDVVARQDSDDLSRPDRCALTVPLVASGQLDAVGGAIQEFDGPVRGALRRYPLTASEIESWAKLRSPMAHPTVVFRKSAVLDVGGYRPIRYLEDYDLWVRLIVAGAKLGNVHQVVVDYRVSAATYRRRGGLQVLRAEWVLQNDFRRLGFISALGWARNLAVRGGFEVSPPRIRRRLLPRNWPTTVAARLAVASRRAAS
jgi:glycosyltransferase involved in cell wall biosynthesis